MAKYRKKPVVIEAIQFHGTPESAIEVFEMFDIFAETYEAVD